MRYSIQKTPIPFTSLCEEPGVGMDKLKVMTILGTRPEIIRLSRVISALDESVEHVLVHTGQNYDFELNEVFFGDLGLRKPKYFLSCGGSSLGEVHLSSSNG